MLRLKILYAAGLAFLLFATVLHTVPLEVEEDGKSVKLWGDGFYSISLFALEPPFTAFDYFTDSLKKWEDLCAGEKGDSPEDVFKEHQGHDLYRIFYSLPAFLGLIGICESLFVGPFTLIERQRYKDRRILMRIFGTFILISVPLIAGDFYYWGNLWAPYSHIGLGAYAIVASYLLIGTSFWLSTGPREIHRFLSPAAADDPGNK